MYPPIYSKVVCLYASFWNLFVKDLFHLVSILCSGLITVYILALKLLFLRLFTSGYICNKAETIDKFSFIHKKKYKKQSTVVVEVYVVHKYYTDPYS